GRAAAGFAGLPLFVRAAARLSATAGIHARTLPLPQGRAAKRVGQCAELDSVDLISAAPDAGGGLTLESPKRAIVMLSAAQHLSTVRRCCAALSMTRPYVILILSGTLKKDSEDDS